jgi:hypothetical protein
MRPLRAIAAVLVALLAFTACGTPNAGTGAGGTEQFGPEAEIPQLGGSAQGGADAGAGGSLGEEEIAVEESAPPGLHIVNVVISPVTDALRDAINFTGFQSGGTQGLLELPIYGLNPRQKIYYLIVSVINEGDQPVRNLKGRADFFDAQGRQVWSETVALTHYPTRLALNPPSLPNTVDPQPPLGPDINGYPLYYFPTNVGLFAFAVPDASIAEDVRSWKLTFLVSTS